MLKQKFCLVSAPRSYSTVVSHTLNDAVSPHISMPGPPEVGFELLHFKYRGRVAALHGLPMRDDPDDDAPYPHDREFIEAYYARVPAQTAAQRIRTVAKRVLGRRPRNHYVGFKTFPFFHLDQEFFHRRDITFIVLRRVNLDRIFLSWVVSRVTGDYVQTFNEKLGDFRFANVTWNTERLTWMIETLVSNMRVMGDLLDRGAIEIVVDEQDRVLNSPRLDEYFGTAVDFSVIKHRSNYDALPDNDLYQEMFRDYLRACLSKYDRVPRLVQEFLQRVP